MNFRMLNVLVLAVSSLFIFSCSDDDNADGNKLEAGDYKGKWFSKTATQTFSNLAISARITEVSPGKFEGSFFISDKFVSCCDSGKDDGAITFTISDANISGFVWNDIIPDCNGTFNGTGTITAKNTFSIEFTGNDCDGDHTGNLTLAK